MKVNMRVSDSVSPKIVLHHQLFCPIPRKEKGACEI